MTAPAPQFPAALLARRTAMIEAVAATIGDGAPDVDAAGIVDAVMTAAATGADSTASYARQLMAAGIISASAAQRALAGKAHHNGKAEHLDFAEWLEDYANSLLHLGT